MQYDFTSFDQKVSAAREWLAREYKNVRTGRASPSILDSISVAAYGSLTPLKQIANIGVEDARTLRVAPWDASLIKDIERAIAGANLGVGTGSDQSGVRVTFPELTGERRAELVKIAKKTLEEARAAIRVARDETWKEIQEAEKEGGMSEDDKFRLKDEMQKKVDAGNDALEEAFAAKEKEMSA